MITFFSVVAVQVGLYAVPVLLREYNFAGYEPQLLAAIAAAVVFFIWFFMGLLQAPDEDGSGISLKLFFGLVVGLTANAMVYTSFGVAGF